MHHDSAAATMRVVGRDSASVRAPHGVVNLNEVAGGGGGGGGGAAAGAATITHESVCAALAAECALRWAGLGGPGALAVDGATLAGEKVFDGMKAKLADYWWNFGQVNQPPRPRNPKPTSASPHNRPFPLHLQTPAFDAIVDMGRPRAGCGVAGLSLGPAELRVSVNKGKIRAVGLRAKMAGQEVCRTAGLFCAGGGVKPNRWRGGGGRG